MEPDASAPTPDQPLESVPNMQVAPRRRLQVAYSGSAIRPRTDSEAHAYFGRVTVMQTAADQVGVATCATVVAGQGKSRDRSAGGGRLLANGHHRCATDYSGRSSPAAAACRRRHQCQIRDSRRMDATRGVIAAKQRHTTATTATAPMGTFAIRLFDGRRVTLVEWPWTTTAPQHPACR